MGVRTRVSKDIAESEVQVILLACRLGRFNVDVIKESALLSLAGFAEEFVCLVAHIFRRGFRSISDVNV